MNGEADNSRFVSMHVYLHLAFKELNGISSPLGYQLDRDAMFTPENKFITNISAVKNLVLHPIYMHSKSVTQSSNFLNL